MKNPYSDTPVVELILPTYPYSHNGLLVLGSTCTIFIKHLQSEPLSFLLNVNETLPSLGIRGSQIYDFQQPFLDGVCHSHSFSNH